MNARIAILSLVVVMALAGVSWLLLRAPAPSAPGLTATWMTELDSKPVDRILLRYPQGGPVDIARTDGPWLMTSGTTTWPAEAERASSLLRLLAEAGRLPTTPEASSALAAVEVGFSRSSGGEQIVSIAPAAMGGRSIIISKNDPPGVEQIRLADGGLAKVVERNNIEAWRTPSALPRDLSRVSRLRIESAGLSVSLARTLGKWGVVSPVTTPASGPACDQLVRALGGIGVRRFIGAPDKLTAAWADSPTTFVSIETEESPADSARRVLVQELRVGGASDSAGTRLLALAAAEWLDPTSGTRTAAWGPMILEVDHEAIQRLSPDAIVYFAKEAVATPAADVAEFWFAPCDGPDPLDQGTPLTPPRSEELSSSAYAKAAVARTLDGWKRSSPPGASALSAGDQSVIKSLVAMLCSTPADTISPERPKGSACVASAVLCDARDAPLTVVGLGEIPGPKGPTLVVRSGRIYRSYSGPSVGAIVAWLKQLFPTEG